MRNKKERESGTENGTSRSPDNPQRRSIDKKETDKKEIGEKELSCGICRKETKALRQCRNCKLVFCPMCLTKEYNAQGQVTKVYPQCPRCRGTNLEPC